MPTTISRLREDFVMLVETSEGPCVSLYMPTQQVGDVDEDIIRFKNMLGEADSRLQEMGLRAPRAADLLEPAKRFLDGRLDFWQHQSDGLALFASPGLFNYYQLPLSFEALVVVSDRFHTKPLLPLLRNDFSFYVLALSQKSVRLFHCSLQGCRRVTAQGIPASMAEALKYDDPESQLQFHTGTSDYQGKRAAIFHGHGVGKDDSKTDISRFSRHVAKGVQEVLSDEHAPLILAAVDYLQPIFREVNKYPYMWSQGVSGNPDDLSGGELLERSRPLVESFIRQERLKAVQEYKEVSHTALASRDLKDILMAAHEGRVSTLFLASGIQNWGFFDYANQEVRLLDEPSTGSRDLLDLAAALAWSNRGDVYVLESENMPDSATVAATFRY